jgi:hypothetical protein
MLKHALLFAAAAFLGGMTMTAAPASAQMLVASGYVAGGPVYFDTTTGPFVPGYTLARGILGERVYVRTAPVVATEVIATPVVGREVIVTRTRVMKPRWHQIGFVPVSDSIYGYAY